MQQAIFHVDLAARRHGKFSKEYVKAIRALERLIHDVESGALQVEYENPEYKREGGN